MSEYSALKPIIPSATLNGVVDTMKVALFALDISTGVILYANEQLCEDIMVRPHDIIGKKYDIVFWDKFINITDKIVAQVEINGHYTEIIHWDERGMWGQVNSHSIKWNDDIEAVIITITNITELGKSEYEYRRMFFYDNLLNIPNGRQLEIDIKQVHSFDDTALIHFDIKRFSTINDLYGWDTGDFLLVQIRDWLLATSFPTSQLYRVSDDEFCLLIQHISLRDAISKVDLVQNRFTSPWRQLDPKKKMPLYCGITMGLVYGEPLGGDIRNLLYRTINHSQSGTNFTLYDASMDKAAREELMMRQSLVNCIYQDMLGFQVVFQPIVEAATGRWAGAEALCRWEMPRAGKISPLVFIGAAEDIGMIDLVDTWVLQTAMISCIQHGLAGKKFFLDVNVSPKQDVNDDYIKNLMGIITDCNFPTNQLNLEITESGKFDASNSNIKRWRTLRESGITVALDDFGTGYSSFNNLVKLPASVIKIEKAFLENIERDEYLQYLLKLMVDLAHTLKMKIVTEGVETQEQADLLKGYGVDYMQGFLFSKPIPIEELAEGLAKFA